MNTIGIDNKHMTFLVRVHFNPDSKETLQDKLQSLPEDEISQLS